jgi:thioredoxin reductase
MSESDLLVDVAIVGGGPAGQGAAEQLVAAGLTVAVVDEQARPGGQILRQPPKTFSVRHWLPGRAYTGVKAQLARFEALPGIRWVGRTSVVGLFRGQGEYEYAMLLSGPEGGSRIQARFVLIAAGCYDLPAALPGWTLPGVMSAGGIQAFIKSQLLMPGERFVLTGTHPLQLVLADQILKGGGAVAAVLFAQPLLNAVAPLLRKPFTTLRHASTLIAAALCCLRLCRAGVPIRFGRTVRQVLGDRRVDGVILAPTLPGSTVQPAMMACDRVTLCFGFLPQSDLPRLAGADMTRNPSTGGWAATHNEWMRSSVPGLFVAGETTGVEGAEVALREGRLAGLGIALAAGRIALDAAEAKAGPTRAQLKPMKRFAAMLDELSSPASILPYLADKDTLICRCEDVTRADIEGALSGPMPPCSANALKLVTRAGMGLCQGRSCEHAILRIVAARMGSHNAPLPGFTPRFPIRPVSISSLTD